MARRWSETEDTAVRLAAAAWSSSLIGLAGPRRLFGSGRRGCAPFSSRATSAAAPAAVLRWQLDDRADSPPPARG